MTSINWSEWRYSPGIGHHRYAQGDPYSTTKTYLAVEKHGDVYNWAVFPSGRPTVYGHASSLAAARRDADRTETTLRLADADEAVRTAAVALREARAARDLIRAELRPRGRAASA